MKIKLLPYESCFRIGEQAFTKEDTISSVWGLEPDVFDRIFEVVEMLYDDATNFYHVAEKVTRVVDGEYKDLILDWWVPVIFVSYILH